MTSNPKRSQKPSKARTVSYMIDGFTLIGGFPDLFEKLRPKDIPIDRFIKILVESWLVDKKILDEYKEYVKGLDFFIMNIDGQNTIFSNEYKDEIKQFLDERTTSPKYCLRIKAKRANYK